MSIAAIIVNYKTAEMVIRHLPAIRAELSTVPGSHLYIVDNASPSDDAPKLIAAAQNLDDVTVISAPNNGGFSYGNNRGFEQAAQDGPYDYYLMLNPDAYPRPGCLTALIAFLQTHPNAGVVAPRLEGEDGVPQRSAFNDFTLLNEFVGAVAFGPLSKAFEQHLVAPPQKDHAHPTDWVAGAALLIRRDVLETVGPMDEDYFLYYEEVDHQRAMRQAGYDIWYEPAVACVHLVGQATGLKDGRQEDKAIPPDFWYDSRRRYFVKNRNKAVAFLADMAKSFGHLSWALRRKLKGQSTAYEFDGIKAMARARQRAASDPSKL